MTDPTRISGKHQQTVKSYCKTFFDKAASKYETREKRKSEKSTDVTPAADADTQMFDEAGITLPLPNEDDETASLKRKREDNQIVDGADDGDSSPSKLQKSTPPPPPPPPPPAEAPKDNGDGDTSMGNADDPSPPKDSFDANMEEKLSQDPQVSIKG